MTEILVVLGVAAALFYRRSAKIGTTFLVFSGGSLVILLATLVIPRLGVILTGSRLYGITLLFLAPLCIFGIERVTDRASRRLTLNAQKTATLKSITVLAILVPYFLFNAGFVFEVAERPVNYAFNPLQTQTTHPITYNDVASWSYLTSTRYSPEGIRASVWLSQFKDGSRVYTDSSNKELISYGHVSPDSIVTLKYSMFKDQPDANAYFYLGAANVQQGTLAVPISGGSEQVPASWFGALKAADRVYSNGLTDVCRFT